jgi:phosphoglycerate kinase
VGPQARQAAASLGPGEVLLLENLRFHPEEERNDPPFARALSSLAELFVNDAFGVAHRSHASTVGVARHLPSVAGLLLERELTVLTGLLDSPQRPLCALLGGAKIDDKMAVLANLVGRVDHLLIGGGMAASFLKEQGYPVGGSPVEEEGQAFARSILHQSQERGLRLSLPVDLVVAPQFRADAPWQVVPAEGVPPGWFIMDVGPRTLETFCEALGGCRTVFWNGPLGVFEFPAFSQGTRRMAEALAGATWALTVVGGGSTAEAVEALGLAGRMTHVSTGGGASLEFLGGHPLPGVVALRDQGRD